MERYFLSVRVRTVDVEEFRVEADIGNYEPVSFGAAENMARDERILEKAAEDDAPYLRVYSFEEPAFVPSRRTSLSDVEAALENGYDVTRRNTNGSTIPCLDNGIAYSVAYPTDEFPDKVFEDRVAPALVEALEYAGVEDVNVGLKHDSIRYGDDSTPGDAADGKTLAGSSTWKTKDAVLSHGVIAVEPWNSGFLDENMVLRPGEKDFVESLPSVEAAGGSSEELVYGLLEGFTGGEYVEADVSEVGELLDGKYRDSEWIASGSVEQRGHCFVEEEDGDFY